MALRNRYFHILALCLLVSLGCSILIPSSTTAVPISTAVTAIEIPYAKIIYYDVSGSTETEIRDQLNTFSPSDFNGNRGDAVTNWDIRWTWDGYGSETCDLHSVTATYDIRVTVPRWYPGKDISPELISKWNAYMLALAEHEKGHVDNVVANLPAVIHAIRGATCATAEVKAQEVLTGIRQNDLNYDERTGHGATQGAVFP